MSFDIRWPPLFSQLLAWMSAVDLDLPSLVPLSCLVPINFHASLAIQTLVPIALVAILWALSKLLKRWAQRHEAARASLRASAIRNSRASARVSSAELEALTESHASWLWRHCNDAIFLIIFLVYPGCVAKVSAAFLCIPLPEGNLNLLRADLSIDCTSDANRQVQYGFALPMVFIYPIGVPALMGYLLYVHRTRLRHWREQERTARAYEVLQMQGLADQGAAAGTYAVADQSSVSDVWETADEDQELPGFVQRLTTGYRRSTFWFEIFEQLRKLALIGISVLFEPGSVLQLVYGLLICFFSFGAYTLFWPYQDDGENLLAIFCQIQIFLSITAKIALDSSSSESVDIALVAFTVAPVALGAALQLFSASDICCGERARQKGDSAASDAAPRKSEAWAPARASEAAAEESGGRRSVVSLALRKSFGPRRRPSTFDEAAEEPPLIAPLSFFRSFFLSFNAPFEQPQASVSATIEPPHISTTIEQQDPYHSHGLDGLLDRTPEHPATRVPHQRAHSGQALEPSPLPAPPANVSWAPQPPHASEEDGGGIGLDHILESARFLISNRMFSGREGVGGGMLRIQEATVGGSSSLASIDDQPSADGVTPRAAATSYEVAPATQATTANAVAESMVALKARAMIQRQSGPLHA